jgi:hypothetical protein
VGEHEARWVIRNAWDFHPDEDTAASEDKEEADDEDMEDEAPPATVKLEPSSLRTTMRMRPRLPPWSCPRPRRTSPVVCHGGGACCISATATSNVAARVTASHVGRQDGPYSS